MNPIFKRKVFLAILLSISVSLATLLILLLPLPPLNLYTTNNISPNPLSGYSDKEFEEEERLSNIIDITIRFDENISFVNSNQGGVSGYDLHLFNNYHSENNINYIRIIHDIAITSLVKTDIFSNKTGAWEYNSTHYEWRNPGEMSIYEFLNIYETPKFTYDDLIINSTLIEHNHEWLKIGQYEIGHYKTITGYGKIQLLVINSKAKEAYYGIESNLAYGKQLEYYKKYVIRDHVRWEVYQNHAFGWQIIKQKTYYLGNNVLEAQYGNPSHSGLILVPYNI